MSSHKTKFFKAEFLALLAGCGLAACGRRPGLEPGHRHLRRVRRLVPLPGRWHEGIQVAGPVLRGPPAVDCLRGLDSTDMFYIAVWRLPGRMAAQKLSALIPATMQEARDLLLGYSQISMTSRCADVLSQVISDVAGRIGQVMWDET